MTSEAETVVRSWEQPIETGDVPESGTQFDAIVVGGGPGPQGGAVVEDLRGGLEAPMGESSAWPAS